jgi:hypothetical protein
VDEVAYFPLDGLPHPLKDSARRLTRSDIG